MEQYEKKSPMPHQLIMQDRRQVELTGVTDVDSFDDATVVAYTSLGALTVQGSGLHIKRLDLDCGILSVEGQVDCLQYTDTHKRGLLGRLFR